MWSVFVHVEGDVVVAERTLTDEEERISTLASQIQEGTGPQGSAARRGALQSPAVLSLLNSHQQTATSYQASLHAEYQFFVTVAQDPTLSAALTEATASVPAARPVVTYDLEAVSTQLHQEQAIAAAESAAAAAATRAQQQLREFARAPAFSAPVGGVVSQGFGPATLAMEPSITFAGVFYEHFHTGIDIANVLDAPVGASAAGRVILAGSNLDSAGKLVGYGNYVVVDHGGGYISLYAHLDQLLVANGQLVQRGQEIGLLGSTGWSTGPHLHFEIRKNGDFVDPETLLGAAVKP
jgi:murein DD-endopeptidase MepM/ murein hydrolase activator NlpD